MKLNIAQKIQELINRNYEYIGNDKNISNGNDIFIFKNGKKKFAVEVYDWEE